MQSAAHCASDTGTKERTVQIPRIDPKNAVGLLDKVVGLGKEITGTVIGNDRITDAGQVQQDKGTERLKAIKAQAKAESYSGRAAASEARQKSAQTVKEASN